MAQGVERGRDVSDWGEVVEAADVEMPVVFHFKPTKFVKISEDKLSDWEEYFAKNVGFKPPQQTGGPGARPWAGSPGGSISGSDDGWDDCDI